MAKANWSSHHIKITIIINTIKLVINRISRILHSANIYSGGCVVQTGCETHLSQWLLKDFNLVNDVNNVLWSQFWISGLLETWITLNELYGAVLYLFLLFFLQFNTSPQLLQLFRRIFCVLWILAWPCISMWECMTEHSLSFRFGQKLCSWLCWCKDEHWSYFSSFTASLSVQWQYGSLMLRYTSLFQSVSQRRRHGGPC